MPLTIRYIPIYTKNVDSEVLFFTQYFNLVATGRIQVTPHTEGVLLKLDANKELYLLIMPDTLANGELRELVNLKAIIHTNDCLRQYFFMKEDGIEFEEKPRHIRSGLAAKFKLPDGSRYMLLEERDYDESLI